MPLELRERLELVIGGYIKMVGWKAGEGEGRAMSFS